MSEPRNGTVPPPRREPSSIQFRLAQFWTTLTPADQQRTMLLLSRIVMHRISALSDVREVRDEGS